jgi:chlorobactene glucosyltransferase
VGKSYACHQLSREAKGDLLLFLDADTVHEPWSIRSAVSEMERIGAGLLSVIPEQRMESFWEKVVLPLLHFSTFCFLPMPLVSPARSPKLAMANGQFMLFRRDAYEAIGGHASVRTALVEDVWLSRRIKESGLRLAVRDGSGTVAARMYRSLGEIWSGFSKNLFAGFRYSLPAITAVILFNLATSILPFVLIGVGLTADPSSPGWLPLAVWQAALVIAIRLMLALRFRLDAWPALLHPLAMAVFIGIALNSVRSVLFGGGPRWKGRKYDFRSQPATQP